MPGFCIAQMCGAAASHGVTQHSMAGDHDNTHTLLLSTTGPRTVHSCALCVIQDNLCVLVHIPSILAHKPKSVARGTPQGHRFCAAGYAVPTCVHERYPLFPAAERLWTLSSHRPLALMPGRQLPDADALLPAVACCCGHRLEAAARTWQRPHAQDNLM